MDPTLDSMVLTPLCSITLASRPLVLTGSSIVTLTPRKSGNAVLEGKFGKVFGDGSNFESYCIVYTPAMHSFSRVPLFIWLRLIHDMYLICSLGEAVTIRQSPFPLPVF